MRRYGRGVLLELLKRSAVDFRGNPRRDRPAARRRLPAREGRPEQPPDAAGRMTCRWTNSRPGVHLRGSAALL